MDQQLSDCQLKKDFNPYGTPDVKQSYAVGFTQKQQESDHPLRSPWDNLISGIS